KALIEVNERYFELVDTGGMGNLDVDNLTNYIEGQIAEALKQASLILFLVDVRSGLLHADMNVAATLRTYGKPVLLVVNKCDHEGLDTQANDFYQLGFSEMACVSAMQKRHKEDVLRWILRLLPKDGDTFAPPENEPLKIAIVGRRNTGKSTFINSLAQEERVISSEVAGTTRDSVDVRFERDNQTFIAIDTAGVRKKRSIKGDIEFYSIARAERSIRRADVVLLFMDPQVKISRVDKQLAEYILMYHKPAIFVINKWDLVIEKGIETGKMAEYVKKTFPSLDFVPIAFITAKTGKNVYPVLNLAQTLYKQACQRVSTADITNVVAQAFEDIPPPIRQNRTPRIFFASQVDANPPTVVLFTNKSDLFDPPYLRYLLKNIRDKLAFNDVPIRLVMRGRETRMMHGDKLEDNYGVEEDFEIEPLKKARRPKIAQDSQGVDDVDEGGAPRGAPGKIGGPRKSVIKKEAPEIAPKPKASPKKKKPDNKTNKGRLWKKD
ncbi:MAG: ribosome biogenesis GTPase Der, partial [Planctomycetes bacterium]|nr:ribosome biogenesis GTPase Der [Planctomycetota bacterium]